MARRRKKQTMVDAIPPVGILVFLGAYWTTNSLVWAGIAAFLAICLLMATVIVLRQRRMDALKRSGISEIDKMDGRQFEHYLGLLFKSQGYKVEVTKSTGDFGADLVIAKEGKRIVVQAKRHSKNVGINAVQEAQAAIAHYKAQEAWVVSNRGYTKPAIQLADANGVRLIDRDELIKMVLQMNPDAVPDPEQVRREVPRATEKCKKCGRDMVIRRSARGEFLGCTGFPACKNTKSLTS